MIIELSKKDRKVFERIADALEEAYKAKVVNERANEYLCVHYDSCKECSKSLNLCDRSSSMFLKCHQ